jgi:hypothetical protein
MLGESMGGRWNWALIGWADRGDSSEGLGAELTPTTGLLDDEPEGDGWVSCAGIIFE